MGLKCGMTVNISDCPTGKNNLITDVAGVKVGHCTLKTEKIKTGVTAIMPSGDNIFRNKLPAAAYVINGFGKSAGLVQIEELGTLESPVILTNTFGIGTSINALVKYLLEKNPEIGDTTGTVNPIAMECNDGVINDIRALAVEESHVFEAMESASELFSEGPVGAGTGMRCYGLKGGIGSSSRIINIDGKTFTVGSLVLSNFGTTKDLSIFGINIGKYIAESTKIAEEKEKGSIIVIIATDIPLSDRQLKRLCKRATVGISRTGSFCGNGSGEIALAFSTANAVSHFNDSPFSPSISFNDNNIDDVFRAVVSSVEESVLSSLLHGESTLQRDRKLCLSLKDSLKFLEEEGTCYYAKYLLEKLGL